MPYSSDVMYLQSHVHTNGARLWTCIVLKGSFFIVIFMFVSIIKRINGEKGSKEFVNDNVHT